MPKLVVDLRGLNYPVRTGVNVYFLNVLKILAEIKKKNAKLEIIGFGLSKSNQFNLEEEFVWFKEVFNYHINSKNQLFSKLQNLTFWLFNLFGIVRLNYNFFGVIPKTTTHFFQPQIKAILVSKNLNWVVATHDFFHFHVPNWSNFFSRPNQVKLLNKNLLNSVNQIWANSISTANQIEHFFYEKLHAKIKLVYPASPNYYTKSKYNSQKYIPKSILSIQNPELLNLKKNQLKLNQYFVAISGIEPRKNWYNLLQAWKILEEKPGWNYTLVLAGRVVDKKYYEDLLELIEKLDLKNIVWKLNVTEEEKSWLLSNSLGLVYPSLFEGFGFPILEAWQNDVPAVVGNMGSSMEIGQGGVLAVNPLDIADIASAIRLLTADEQFRQELIRGGQNRLQNFTWEEYKKRLEEWLGV